MPHNFLQSLKTKDDNKFSVKVLLGRLSRFTMRINDSGLAYNEEYSWTGGNFFFACEKTLPNANDAYYGENTRCSGIYLAYYYINYDTNDNTYLHKAAQVGRRVKVVFDTYWSQCAHSHYPV